MQTACRDHHALWDASRAGCKFDIGEVVSFHHDRRAAVLTSFLQAPGRTKSEVAFALWIGQQDEVGRRGEDSFGEKSLARAVTDQRVKADRFHQTHQALLWQFETERHIGCSSPAGSEHSQAGGDAARSEDRNARPSSPY